MTLRRKGSLMARFMGPTWGPSGAERTQEGPMLAPRTLLSGLILSQPWLVLNVNHSMHVIFGNLVYALIVTYLTNMCYTIPITTIHRRCE